MQMKKIEILLISGFLLLSILVGILIGYVLLPKSKDIYQNISIEDPAVNYLYKMANPSDDVSTLRTLYETENFSNEYILATAFVDFLKEHPNYTENISNEQIDEYVKKIFGNISYTHTSGSVISEYLCSFTYDDTTQNYQILIGCNGNFNERILRKITSAKKSNNEYVLTEKSIVINDNFDKISEGEDTAITIYNDVNHTKELRRITYKDTAPEISLDDYLKDAAVYEYHFEKENNRFIYKSFKRIN